MTRIGRTSVQIALMSMFLLGGAALMAAQHEHKTTTLAVGSKGDVTFTSEVRIADVVLKPGRYYIEHRVEGSVLPRRIETHYIHFTEVTQQEHQRREAVRDSISGKTIAHPGEIECELEALKGKASKTTVFTTTDDGIRRITRIEIAGENVAHIF